MKLLIIRVFYLTFALSSFSAYAQTTIQANVNVYPMGEVTYADPTCSITSSATISGSPPAVFKTIDPLRIDQLRNLSVVTSAYNASRNTAIEVLKSNSVVDYTDVQMTVSCTDTAVTFIMKLIKVNSVSASQQAFDESFNLQLLDPNTSVVLSGFSTEQSFYRANIGLIHLIRYTENPSTSPVLNTTLVSPIYNTSTSSFYSYQSASPVKEVRFDLFYMLTKRNTINTIGLNTIQLNALRFAPSQPFRNTYVYAFSYL